MCYLAVSGARVSGTYFAGFGNVGKCLCSPFLSASKFVRGRFSHLPLISVAITSKYVTLYDSTSEENLVSLWPLMNQREGHSLRA